jgi:hypothetical protein
MTVPYTFGTATTSIPLSNLDANFNTPITLGNTAIYLGNTTTTIGNLTLTNVTISSGSANITSNITYTTANAVVFTNSSSIGTTNSNLNWNGTNFGIGAASPSKKLTVTTNTSADGILITGSTNPRLQVIDTTNSATLELISGDSQATIRTDTNHPLVFGTNGTEQMTLSATGNLGLGVTPSAWTLTNSSALQIRNAGFMGYSNSAYLTANAYNSAGTWKYIASAAAGEYSIVGGAHEWSIAASGTAGNAITFNQAMTLNASSNLGIGTTSPTGRLDVVYDNALVGRFYNSGGRGLVRVDGLSDSSFQAYKDGSLVGFFQTDSGGTEIVTGTSGAFPYSIYTNNTERVRVTSAGLVGINTTNPSYNLSVAGNTASEIAIQIVNSNIGNTGYRMANSLRSWAMFVNDGDSGALRFYDYTANSERMRIDSSGNLLVGTTSQYSSAKVTVSTTASSGIASTQTTTGGYCYLSNALINTATYFHINFLENGTQRGSITSNGTVTVYATTSDYRLKENVKPMVNALATVAQLKPVTYDWTESKINGQGFIAHELQTVIPDAVVGLKDDIDSEGNPIYQQIDTSVLVATLTAAIQELKAEFDAYKATHP